MDVPKHWPPSRLRCEAEHPTVTARVPAEVKVRLGTALEREGLNFSEWIQARGGEHVADAVAAREKGQAEGRKDGEAAGYQKGLQEAQAAAQWGGLTAGLLEAHFHAQEGRAIDISGLVRHLLDHPDRRTIAEALLDQRGHRDDLARLVRRVSRA